MSARDECFCSYEREDRGGAAFEFVLVPNPDCPVHGTETVTEGDALDMGGNHVFTGGRCKYCNTNDLDDSIYGPFECVEREPHRHTTETPSA